VILALGVALDGELQVDQAYDFERESQFAGIGAKGFQGLGTDADGGKDAG